MIGDIYHCKTCGRTVEAVSEGSTDIICCGQPMELQVPNTSSASREKHLPVLEASGSGSIVRVGEVAHVMEAVHWIEWIEIIHADGKKCRKYLNPGDAPEASFTCPPSEIRSVRIFCNLHGVWSINN